MTVSRFYSHILRRPRPGDPTFEEARRDHQRSIEAALPLVLRRLR